MARNKCEHVWVRWEKNVIWNGRGVIRIDGNTAIIDGDDEYEGDRIETLEVEYQCGHCGLALVDPPPNWELQRADL